MMLQVKNKHIMSVTEIIIFYVILVKTFHSEQMSTCRCRNTTTENRVDLYIKHNNAENSIISDAETSK